MAKQTTTPVMIAQELVSGLWCNFSEGFDSTVSEPGDRPEEASFGLTAVDGKQYKVTVEEVA